MNSFYETIFLKEDSSLEAKYNSLKYKSRLTYEDIHMLEAGIAGENQVKYHLNKSNIGMYVLHDINLVCNDLKAQIDFVVVTSHHCYFIECKNYSADIIHVDEYGNFETSTRYGKKYNRMAIKSPLSQVDDQMAVFKKICLNDQNNVKELLSKIKFNDYFKTMVVFTNPDNRMEMKKAPSSIKYRILKVDNLIRQIEYDEGHFKGKKYNQSEMKKIGDYILSKNVEVKIESELNIDEILSSFKPTYLTENNNYNPNKSYNSYSQNVNYNKYNNNARNKIPSAVIFICCLVVLYFVLTLIVSGLNRVYNKQNRSLLTTKTTTTKSIKLQYPHSLTSQELKAISMLKAAKEESENLGFTIIHTSICNEINKFFDNSINCTLDPIEVKLSSESQINIYKPANKKLYIINLSEDGKQIISVSNDIISGNDDQVRGNPIGIVDWDVNNEYYKKIGGYETLRSTAIYAYKHNGFTVDYFTSVNIEKRGGNSYAYSTYFLNVHRFFLGITGVSGFKSDTNRKNFEEMVESYYYIMKEN